MTWLDALLIVIATLIGVGFGYHLRTLNLRGKRRQESMPHPPASRAAANAALPQQISATEAAARQRAMRIRQTGDATTHLPPQALPASAETGEAERYLSLQSSATGPERIAVSTNETVLARHLVEGLASDLTLRLVGDIIMVRAAGEGSSIIIDDVHIPITRIEVPWRNGHIASGAFVIQTDHPASPPTLQAQVPGDVQLHVVAQESWMVVAEHRSTAIAAAQLFVPQNLDPVGSWRERFQAYQAIVRDAFPGKASLVWMPEGQIEVGGTLVTQVGLAAEGDDFPGGAQKVPFSEAFHGPTRLTQVWMQVGEHWGADDCIIVQRRR